MITVIDSIVVNAPIRTVFDAERNISLHANTQQYRGEKAVDGVTSGLISLGEEVEWEANHFGIRQRMRVRVTRMDQPGYFRDEMIKGVFKYFAHDHRFTEIEPGKTEKHDVLEISAPLGPLGLLAERLFLGRYMKSFIRDKNQAFKALVESMT